MPTPEDVSSALSQGRNLRVQSSGAGRPAQQGASDLLNLSVFREGKKTQEIGTEKDTVFIGRDASCDVVLDDRTTSRRHASVTVQEDGVYLEDLDSRNGTFIDGKAVKRHKLSGDDVIQIGDYQISVGGHPALTRKIKRADDDRPTEMAIISKIDALSVSKGQDIREGVVDEKAMAKRLAALYNLGHELCGQLSVSEITGTRRCESRSSARTSQSSAIARHQIWIRDGSDSTSCGPRSELDRLHDTEPERLQVRVPPLRSLSEQALD